MIKEYVIKLIYRACLIYLRLKNWSEYQEFKKKHISLEYKNGLLRFNVVEHRDFVNHIQNQTKKFEKRHNAISTIKYALNKALSGCNYVIFQDKDNENQFIQFWTANGKLKHEFPMSESNGLHSYRLAITSLLANLGYVNRIVISKYNEGFRKYKKEFWLDKTDEDLWTVVANFNKDINLAKKYTHLALKNVLKVNPRRIVIKFG